jgi:GNAT superfamily N-acetyltransferase
MDIVALDPDSHLVEAITPLRTVLTTADSPWNEPGTTRQFTAMLRHGWDGEPPRFWVGLEQGEPVALGSMWTSSYDNLDHAGLGVDVRPDLRRRGLGSRMLAHLEGLAVAEGRPKVEAGSWESDALDGFTARHGYERASQGIQRRQHLGELPDGWRDLLDEAVSRKAADYDVVEVAGAVPEGESEAIVRLWGDINDAPTDDLDIEDEVFSVDRIRGYEAAQSAAGMRMHHLVARHRETGELGGHTIVAIEDERPYRAHQHDTTVARAHRGHRLGLVLKATMMDVLLRDEPQLRTVDTWNAESNSYMISVNEQLGYRVMGRQVEYQRKLG